VLAPLLLLFVGDQRYHHAVCPQIDPRQARLRAAVGSLPNTKNVAIDLVFVTGCQQPVASMQLRDAMDLSTQFDSQAIGEDSLRFSLYDTGKYRVGSAAGHGVVVVPLSSVSLDLLGPVDSVFCWLGHGGRYSIRPEYLATRNTALLEWTLRDRDQPTAFIA